MQRHALTIAVTALLPLAGCSSFEREWKAAPAKSCWSGRWTSERHLINGKPAGGELRAILSEPKDGKVDAHFRASWLVFASDYRVTLEARRRSGGLDLSGAQTIKGYGGGLYRYSAQQRGDHMKASYEAEYDTGSFDLHRKPER